MLALACEDGRAQLVQLLLEDMPYDTDRHGLPSEGGSELADNGVSDREEQQ